MLTLDAATDLIRAYSSGGLDPSELLADPVLIIDADSCGDAADLEIPSAFAAVVVAVSESEAPALSPRGPDVAVTARRDAPRPWVTEPDVEAAAAGLVDGVRTTPGAALALVQILRTTASRSAEEGIVVESLAYSMLQAGPEFQRWRERRPEPPGRPQSGPTVLVTRTGDRLDLTLNRPAVHNAYNLHMRDELYDALAVAASDPACSVRMQGAGPSFCSGGDLDEFGTFPDPVTAHRVRSARSPARLLADLAPRVTAVIHGSCAGSGIELPAFAGWVVAQPDTQMWLPELAMGLVPGAGGTVSLPRRIGRGRTAWMGLTGGRVDASTAHRWGLVDEVVGQDR